MAQATLAVGLAGAFAAGSDVTHPGGFSRDDVQFHVVDVVANTLFLDDYELRGVMDASWSLSYPLEQESGEVVMMARSDNVGGPLDATAAALLLGRLDGIGRTLELEGPLSLLLPHERAVVLPPPSLAGVFQFKPDHPLHGVPYFSVLDAIALLDKLAEVDPETSIRVRTLLELCRDERLPLSWRRSG